MNDSVVTICPIELTANQLQRHHTNIAAGCDNIRRRLTDTPGINRGVAMVQCSIGPAVRTSARCRVLRINCPCGACCAVLGAIPTQE